MKNNTTVLLLLIISLLNYSFQNLITKSGNLKVIVTGIRNAEGEIELELFNTADGFPTEKTKAFKTLRSKITNGTCLVSFDNIPYGDYAVGIYHNENNNNKMDESWYGMPKEGVGVSNNPSVGVFSPPKFESAKFNFDALKNSISIKVKYL